MSVVNPPPSDFTHVDERGRLRMVDVTEKAPSRRSARASCRIITTLSHEDLAQIVSSDVILRTRLIGIQAAKRTSDVIPLCHPLSLTNVAVSVHEMDEGFVVESSVTCEGRTGVEMEALSACGFAGVALLEALQRDSGAHMTQLLIESKRGGTSGDWGRAGDVEES